MTWDWFTVDVQTLTKIDSPPLVRNARQRTSTRASSVSPSLSFLNLDHRSRFVSKSLSLNPSSLPISLLKGSSDNVGPYPSTTFGELPTNTPSGEPIDGAPQEPSHAAPSPPFHREQSAPNTICELQILYFLSLVSLSSWWTLPSTHGLHSSSPLPDLGFRLAFGFVSLLEYEHLTKTNFGVAGNELPCSQLENLQIYNQRDPVGVCV